MYTHTFLIYALCHNRVASVLRHENPTQSAPRNLPYAKSANRQRGKGRNSPKCSKSLTSARHWASEGGYGKAEFPPVQQANPSEELPPKTGTLVHNDKLAHPTEPRGRRRPQ